MAESFSQEFATALQTADDFHTTATTLDGKMQAATSAVESLNGKVDADFFMSFNTKWQEFANNTIASTINELNATGDKLETTARDTEAFAQADIQM